MSFIIVVSHLNIVEVIAYFDATEKIAFNKNIKDTPIEEEKESKEKEEEQKKIFDDNTSIINNQYILFNNHKFLCVNTVLNIHPYTEDEIQPPKAA